MRKNHALNSITYKNSALFFEETSVESLAKTFGTPLYVYSKKEILKPVKTIQKEMSGYPFKIHFALKANSNISVLRLLKSVGVGADIVSLGELYRAQAAGMAPDQIVFSGVGKTSQEIAAALMANVFSFHVESVPELLEINRIAIELKKVAPIAFRFNPDIDPKTHPYISTGLKRNKFGLNKSEILAQVKCLSELPGVHLHGLSIHIGSQLLEIAPLKKSFESLLTLAKEIESLLNYPLEFLDLGGGLGISYENEKPISISTYCSLIKKIFKKDRTLLIEPGRVIVGNAGILITEVLYRKVRPKKDFLIVDASMSELLRPSLYGSYHHVLPIKKPLQTAKLKSTDIVGPVCESSDFLARDRSFSSQVKKGDLLAVLSAGAYGFTMASNYNSRPRPGEVLVSGKTCREIRKREILSDLIRGE